MTAFDKKCLKLILLICGAGLLQLQVSFSQTRVAMNALAGASAGFASVKSDYGGAFNFSLTYMPFRLVGIIGDVGVGALAGYGPAQHPKFIEGNEGSTAPYTYSTSYYSYGLGGILNLQTLLMGKTAPKRWIPYVIVGFNYIDAHSQSQQAGVLATMEYRRNYYSNYVAAMLRVYVTRKVDFVTLIKYNSTQTYYLDAVPVIDKYDSFISILAGISYKVGVTSKSKHGYMDWSRKPGVICPRFF